MPVIFLGPRILSPPSTAVGAIGVTGAPVVSRLAVAVAPKLVLALVPIQHPPTAEPIVPAHLPNLELVVQMRVPSTVAGVLGVTGAPVVSRLAVAVAPKLVLALVPIQHPPTAEPIVPAHLSNFKLVVLRRVQSPPSTPSLPVLPVLPTADHQLSAGHLPTPPVVPQMNNPLGHRET